LLKPGASLRLVRRVVVRDPLRTGAAMNH
jgi:hypothetical protein